MEHALSPLSSEAAEAQRGWWGELTLELLLGKPGFCPGGSPQPRGLGRGPASSGGTSRQGIWVWSWLSPNPTGSPRASRCPCVSHARVPPKLADTGCLRLTGAWGACTWGRVARVLLKRLCPPLHRRRRESGGQSPATREAWGRGSPCTGRMDPPGSAHPQQLQRRASRCGCPESKIRSPPQINGKKKIKALAGVAQWNERRLRTSVAGSNPSQGTCLGCRP
ncbi:hypothetical protein HJG60_010063 [Phyllostomus discolor]|uniref:Uncharacterized protein n=1 Tax=Phyllostomus discolor TaxID=89673 RepID=A0A834AXP8_9CHIR|nr:hypothetical protein HJG60_010063 [Phyllostomus discolor]